MKTLFFALLFLVHLTVPSFSQNEEVPNISATKAESGPKISWENPSHDFGELVQGEKVEHVYKFTNTGDEPLVITNVQVTCGCTTPKGWVRDPIMPGQSGEIVISFNSTGKMGAQTKVSTVVSNAVNPEGARIRFTANVVKKNSSN